jgi:hypothetical protein
VLQLLLLHVLHPLEEDAAVEFVEPPLLRKLNAESNFSRSSF